MLESIRSLLRMNLDSQTFLFPAASNYPGRDYHAQIFAPS
jgi:hypothetical protein